MGKTKIRMDEVLRIIAIIIFLWLIWQIINSPQGHSLTPIEIGLGLQLSLLILVLSFLWNMNEKLSSIDKTISLGFERLAKRKK
ncbi:MAG: hypothetical protein KAW41_05595 [Candidatus Diapherotrites archaeon]|nr:hypothetical protein [Candidatus Diapherotrites archaeon]